MLLDKRLNALAAHVPAACRVADIGCDHGKLACALAARGCDVWAVDISPLCLDKTRARAANRGLMLNLCHADGLQPLPDDIDCIVIAGLGGESITQILQQRPALVARAKLVLSPASRPDRLWDALEAMDLQPERDSINYQSRTVPIFLCGGQYHADRT